MERRPICVVEDGLPIRRLMEVLLTKAGYKVVAFEQGREAIEWLQHNRPLAVLSDLILPDVNGVEVLRAVRVQPGGGEIPVIAVTGLAQESDQQYYLQQGFDAYIVKPLSTATFAHEVRRAIERKQALLA
ncbi:MAG: response regulator [Candidatus Kapabacteria bacterium]|nr:response regulator [Candidatus Kapabacteria bacterium]MDW7996908.1 response regulator [Bacteroidota bacterium]MDW8225759.1 response regulator [Bacteroidota bacterium]